MLRLADIVDIPSFMARKGALALVGFLCLGAGYYIAITTENPLKALMLFFVAVGLVVIGTYCLFTAGSIVILKALRKRN